MRLPREQAARKEGSTQEGPWKGRDLSSDEDLVSEATPETVRQDRGAGDPRVTKLTNTGNQVSAQMGAGSNAGPHFYSGVAVAAATTGGRS